MGRPRKIKSVRQFEERAEAYFMDCEAKGEPVLLTGLILALGLCSREGLDEYGRRSEFADSVKGPSSGSEWSTRRPCIPATRPGRSSP